MNYFIKILWLSFCCLFASISFSYGPGRYGKIADSLFLHKQYEKAIVYYEKGLFFNEDIPATSLFNLALCYQYLKKYTEANRQLDLLEQISNSADTSLFCKIKIQKAINYYYLGKYVATIFQFTSLLQQYNDSLLIQPYEWLLGLAYLEEQNIPQMNLAFQHWIRSLSLSSDEKKLLFLRLHKLSRKMYNLNRFPYWMYYLGPWGQMIAGFPEEAFFSVLLLSSTTAWIAYNLFITHTYFTAIAVGGNVLYSFWTGSARHAEYLKNHRKEKIKQQIKDTIFPLL